MSSGLVELAIGADEHFFDIADERGWTDGLPVVPPTEERVARMMAAAPDGTPKSLGQVAPRRGEASIERVAANAVMAGCRPEHFPIVLAAVSLLCDEAMNTGSMQATTSPATPLVIVNGPIREVAGIHSGRGCLGPGHRANATIGRALRLVLINIGGGVPDEIDKSTHGLPAKFTLCLGENSEESPWPSLHDERGLIPGTSSVSMTSVLSVINVRLPDPRPTSVENEIAILGDALSLRGSKSVQVGGGRPVVVLSVGTARILAAAGYDKSRLRKALFQSALRPGDDYADQPLTRYRREDGMVLPTTGPDDIVIVVAGGPEPNQALVMSSFVDSALLSAPVGEPKQGG